MTATPKGVLTGLYARTGIKRATRKQLVIAFVERGISVRTAQRKIDELIEYGILFQMESTVPEGHEVFGCTWWCNPISEKVEAEKLTDAEREIMRRKGLVA